MSRLAPLFVSVLTWLAASAAFAADRVEKGALVLENVPETPPAVAERIRQYQNTRGASLKGFLAEDDGLLVTTRFGETDQVHLVASPGGARRQLTYFDEPLRTVIPSPNDPNLFLYLRDVGGDENYQLYLFDRARGASQLLSDGEGRKGAPIWSPDGTRVAWQTTLEGPAHGVVVADIADPDNRRMAFMADGWWGPVDWSRDGRFLMLFHYISINESELYLFDVETEAMQQINPSSRAIAYGGAAFGPDMETVYFTADEDGEFLDLIRYHLPSGERMNLTNDIDWDVSDFEIAPDGATYAYIANEAGRSTLHVRRLRSDRPLPSPDLPAGVVYGLDYAPDGDAIGFTLNAATAPGDIYTWSVRGRGELNRWTASEVGGLSPETFVGPSFFDYPTFDMVSAPDAEGAEGAQAPRRIQGFIYRPTGEGPHPVVISIHGGPEGQSRPYFSSVYQHWVNELGVAVVLPNVRGSSGFGKSFVALDNGVNREASVKDIGALIDWIETQDELDPNRVMVYGGSYGGYMVLASMVEYGDRLAGGVDIVGISNFVTFLENTSDYRRDLRRVEYGDERDPDMRAFLERISPLTRADEITKPLFVIQGLNDPRVPASEAEQLLAAVRKNGGEAWYMAAKDEGHGFRKKSNRDAMTEAVALFIDQVIGEPVAAPAEPETPEEKSDEPSEQQAAAAPNIAAAQ